MKFIFEVIITPVVMFAKYGELLLASRSLILAALRGVHVKSDHPRWKLSEFLRVNPVISVRLLGLHVH